MAQSLCGDSISSRRGLLASLWALVTILTAISFLTAFIFAMSTKNSDNDDDDYYYQQNQGGGSQDYDIDAEIAVTSRALAFSALWTAVLSALMSVFGTVILGWQSPTGQYYTCCSNSVHRTTPLGLGSFIGALLMFANLTLICSVLFGEFEVCSVDFKSYKLISTIPHQFFFYHRFEITEKAKSELLGPKADHMEQEQQRHQWCFPSFVCF